MLQHFYAGLDKESAHHLDLTYGGSFDHLTPTEGREVHNKIMDRTSFICVHEPTPAEPEVHQEEVSAAESEPIESQSVVSTPEPSPELKPETPKEEDPQPLEFLQDFEDDLFEDFGNTSNFSCQKRPPVRHTIQELTALMSNEWLREGELSLNSIQIYSPSSSFHCRIKD